MAALEKCVKHVAESETRWEHGPAFGVMLFVAVFLLCDIGAAQVLKRLLPAWNFEARGAVERKYRVRSPLYHHDLRPLVDVTTLWGNTSYRLRTNSLGFRDARARVVPLKHSRPRVLFIGDSFTEGIGVSYDSTFVGRIARELEPRGFEVLNAGVAGYSPAIYYRKIKNLLEERGLQVSSIVVCIDIADVYNEARQYRLGKDGRVEELPTPGLTKRERLKQLLKDNSVLMRVLDATKDVLGNRKRYALDEDIARWTLSKSLLESYGRLGLSRARANMDRLVAVARRQGIPVVVVVYPWPDQIAERDLNSLQVSFWTAWARDRGVTLIDLFPAFVGGEDPLATIRQNFMAYDYHWNAAGHRIVAEGILKSGSLPLSDAAPGKTSAVDRISVGAGFRHAAGLGLR
jgi:hypothetical protein